MFIIGRKFEPLQDVATYEVRGDEAQEAEEAKEAKEAWA